MCRLFAWPLRDCYLCSRWTSVCCKTDIEHQYQNIKKKGVMASSVSLKPFVSSSHANFSSTPGNFLTGFGPKKQILTEHKLKLNFSLDREMDVNTSAPVDGVAECLGGKKIEEPSIATILMNLSNKSDPSCVLSTPVREAATSKQKIRVAHVCGALLRVDNSIMSPLFSQPLEFGAGIKFVDMT